MNEIAAKIRAYFPDGERRGQILDMDWDAYGIYGDPVHRLDGMEPREMAQWQRRALIEFYLRPRKLWRLLTSVRSLAQWRLLWSAAGIAWAIIMRKVTRRAPSS